MKRSNKPNGTIKVMFFPIVIEVLSCLSCISCLMCTFTMVTPRSPTIFLDTSINASIGKSSYQKRNKNKLDKTVCSFQELFSYHININGGFRIFNYGCLSECYIEIPVAVIVIWRSSTFQTLKKEINCTKLFPVFYEMFTLTILVCFQMN